MNAIQLLYISSKRQVQIYERLCNIFVPKITGIVLDWWSCLKMP